MKFGILIFFYFLVTSFAVLIYGEDKNLPLTKDDIDWIHERNGRGPYLSSAIDADEAWEAYDQWKCFKSLNIQFECGIYGDDIEVPGLIVERSNHTYLFDLHVEDGFICDITLSQWKKLINNSATTCIMAAEMPGVFSEGTNKTSLWYMHAIKTEQGYWVAN